jgi:antitoxin FitA
MPSLTIKNVPISILERLKAQAASHRRSLNLEVITCLEAITHSVPLDSETLLARFRMVRVKPSGPRLTDRVLTRLKNQGRP